MKRAALRQAAFTLSETIIGAFVTSIVFAALIAGSVAIQQQFAASTRFAEAQADQIRVLDWIEVDLRRATAVTISSGATPLSLTLPNYYQTVSGKKTARLPGKSGQTVQYGSGSVAVTYTLAGGKLTRTEGGVATVIANNLVSFPPPVKSGSYVTSTLSFDTKIKRNGPSNTITLSAKTMLRNLQ